MCCLRWVTVANVSKGHVRTYEGSFASVVVAAIDRCATTSEPSWVRSTTNGPESDVAVDGNLERTADLAHPGIAQASHPFDEDRYRDALDRIEIDARSPWDRVFVRVEDDLAGESANRRRARCDERSAQPRNGRISRKDHDGAATDVR